MSDLRAATIVTLLTVMLLVCGSTAALAKDRSGAVIEGLARIVDGDTIVIGGVHIRLSGMDAPERNQICRDEGAYAYRCGVSAAGALARLIDGTKVTCQSEGLDRYRRTLAICRTAACPDIGLEMIRLGWATAYDGGHVPNEYRLAESRASARKLGLWRGTFDRPSIWRQEQRSGGLPTHA